MTGQPEGQIRHVDELMLEPAKLADRANADLFRPRLAVEAQKALGKFRVDGFDIAPADALGKITAQLEAQHDEELQAALLRFDADAAATEAALEQRRLASRRAPVVKDDLHHLVLFRHFEGRTLADVIAEYQRGDDAVLVGIVEQRRGDVARYFRLAASDTDAADVGRLTAAITARENAREDATAVEHLQVVREARSRFNISLLIRQAKEAARRGDPFELARQRRAIGR